MTFEEALKAELITISELTNVFPLNAPEGTQTPYLVYVTDNGIPDRTLDGNLITKEIECELHILHNSYPNLRNLTSQIGSLLDTFQQRVIGDGFFVQSTVYDKITEQYIPELLQYLCILNLTIRI